MRRAIAMALRPPRAVPDVGHGGLLAPVLLSGLASSRRACLCPRAAGAGDADPSRQPRSCASPDAVLLVLLAHLDALGAGRDDEGGLAPTLVLGSTGPPTCTRRCRRGDHAFVLFSTHCRRPRVDAWSCDLTRTGIGSERRRATDLAAVPNPAAPPMTCSGCRIRRLPRRRAEPISTRCGVAPERSSSATCRVSPVWSPSEACAQNRRSKDRSWRPPRRWSTGTPPLVPSRCGAPRTPEVVAHSGSLLVFVRVRRLAIGPLSSCGKARRGSGYGGNKATTWYRPHAAIRFSDSRTLVRAIAGRRPGTGILGRHGRVVERQSPTTSAFAVAAVAERPIRWSPARASGAGGARLVPCCLRPRYLASLARKGRGVNFRRTESTGPSWPLLKSSRLWTPPSPPARRVGLTVIGVQVFHDWV